MNTNQVSYIKTDDNKIINEKYIKWVKKMSECLEVCVKSDGCREGINTHRICKVNNPEGYQKLNKFFN